MGSIPMARRNGTPTARARATRSTPSPTANVRGAADGRVLTLRGTGEETPSEIRIVLNWFEELERLVPTDN